jgi:hypothetical protein
MSNRITEANLKGMCDTLNRITNSPMEQYTKTETGYKANPLNYHLDFAYGGVKLCRMCNEGGGVNDISSGYGTKRELWDWMQAYLRGIELGKSQV